MSDTLLLKAEAKLRFNLKFYSRPFQK